MMWILLPSCKLTYPLQSPPLLSRCFSFFRLVGYVSSSLRESILAIIHHKVDYPLEPLPTWSLTWPLKSYLPKRNVISQPSFFRGYVKLRGCINSAPIIRPSAISLNWTGDIGPWGSLALISHEVWCFAWDFFGVFWGRDLGKMWDLKGTLTEQTAIWQRKLRATARICYFWKLNGMGNLQRQKAGHY